jgi:hypothetical protein
MNRDVVEPVRTPVASARTAETDTSPLGHVSAAGNRAVAELFAQRRATEAPRVDDETYPYHRYQRQGAIPNASIVENLATCEALMAQCEVLYERQKARAAKMNKPTTGGIGDHDWYFATVYAEVTRNEIDLAKSQAYFYPSYVLRSVLYFEQIYADNLAAHTNAPAKVEPHWKQAFADSDTAEKIVAAGEEGGTWANYVAPDPITGVVSKAAIGMGARGYAGGLALTSAMKAHIRFDLPRAEAWVFNTYYAGTAASLANFYPDFMSMKSVFDNATTAFLPQMQKATAAPLDWLSQSNQERSMRYVFDADMEAERNDTWDRAASSRSVAGTGPYNMAKANPGNVTDRDNHSFLEQLPAGKVPHMGSSRTPPTDAKVDNVVMATYRRMSDRQLAGLADVDKVRIVLILESGVCEAAEKDLILRILASASVSVVDGASALRLLEGMADPTIEWSMFPPDRQAACRKILRERYYPNTVFHTAAGLAKRYLSEGHRLDLVELIEARTDRHAIVAALAGGGAHGEANGRFMLEDRLSKNQWDRVKRVLDN